MFTRTVALVVALSFLITLVPAGPASPVGSASAFPYCAWDPAEPESLGGAALCVVYQAQNCVEGVIDDGTCPW